MTTSGAYSRDEVAGMIRTALPGWTVESVERIDGGRNAVYEVAVTADGATRELVLKARTETLPGAFEPEPFLLDALARRTEVPVPSVLGTVVDHETHPPFFLMERREGVSLSEGLDELATTERDSLARTVGRYVGRVHLLGSFDRFGPLRVERADPETGPVRDGGEPPAEPTADSAGGGSAGSPGGRGDGGPAARPRVGVSTGAGSPRAWYEPVEQGIEEPGFAIGVAETGHGDWASRLREIASTALAALGGRFGDLRAEVRAVLAAVPAPDAKPVLAFGGPTDLLVDPDTGDPTSALDFEDATTTAARYDLVAAVDRLSGWAPPESDRRRRVREGVLVGYETTTGRRPDPGTAACDGCRLVSHLPGLVEAARREAAGTEGGTTAVNRRRARVADLAQRCRSRA
ncbi:MAG: phosphotransferase [Halobacteriales archaeon]